jgi:hypothetical protein
MPHSRPPRKPPPKDAFEVQAEQDVARMRDLLKHTRAEVERAKKLVERIESRKKPKD